MAGFEVTPHGRFCTDPRGTRATRIPMHPETRNQFLSAARPVVILEDRPCGPALRRNPWWPSTLSPNDFTPLMDLPQRLMASSHHCNRIRLQETAYKVGVKVWQRGEGLHASAGRKGGCCSVVRRIVAISGAYFLPREGVVPEEPIRNRESACPKF